MNVVKHGSDGPFKIYIARHHLANTEFTLHIKLAKPYYCVFKHQDRKFEIVGKEVIFSGFEDGDGKVERFNIASEEDFTDPKAKMQLPVIWLDIHEIKGGDLPRRTAVDGSDKAVFYTDHEESRVKYGRTNVSKGTRLRVIKFEVEIVENAIKFPRVNVF